MTFPRTGRLLLFSAIRILSLRTTSARPSSPCATKPSRSRSKTRGSREATSRWRVAFPSNGGAACRHRTVPARASRTSLATTIPTPIPKSVLSIRLLRARRGTRPSPARPASRRSRIDTPTAWDRRCRTRSFGPNARFTMKSATTVRSPGASGFGRRLF